LTGRRVLFPGGLPGSFLFIPAGSHRFRRVVWWRWKEVSVVRRGDVEGFPIAKGVMGRVLLSGERLMLLLVEIEAGGVVPEHSHPHEQMGLCLKGRAEFTAEGETVLVEAGSAYHFPSGERHGVRVVGREDGLFLDVFSPPRENYLKRSQEAVKVSRGAAVRGA